MINACTAVYFFLDINAYVDSISKLRVDEKFAFLPSSSTLKHQTNRAQSVFSYFHTLFLLPPFMERITMYSFIYILYVLRYL